MVLFQPAPGLGHRVMVESWCMSTILHPVPPCFVSQMWFGHEVPQLGKFQIPSLIAKLGCNLHDPKKSDLKGFQAVALLARNCLSLGNCLGFPHLWFVYSIRKFWWHTRCAPGMLDCLIVSMSSGEVQMVRVCMHQGPFEIRDFSMILCDFSRLLLVRSRSHTNKHFIRMDLPYTAHGSGIRNIVSAVPV